jgi:hypothetical protein
VIGAHLMGHGGRTVTDLLDDAFALRKFARQKIDYVGFSCHALSQADA